MGRNRWRQNRARGFLRSLRDLPGHALQKPQKQLNAALVFLFFSVVAVFIAVVLGEAIVVVAAEEERLVVEDATEVIDRRIAGRLRKERDCDCELILGAIVFRLSSV